MVKRRVAASAMAATPLASGQGAQREDAAPTGNALEALSAISEADSSQHEKKEEDHKTLAEKGKRFFGRMKDFSEKVYDSLSAAEAIRKLANG
jgi:hypothetical protein